MTPSTLAFWERCFAAALPGQLALVSGTMYSDTDAIAWAGDIAELCVAEREKRWQSGHTGRCGVTADGRVVCVIGCREQQKAEEATELEEWRSIY